MFTNVVVVSSRPTTHLTRKNPSLIWPIMCLAWR